MLLVEEERDGGLIAHIAQGETAEMESILRLGLGRGGFGQVAATLAVTELTNVTRFPIRRLDIRFAVSYQTDVTRLRRVLLEVAAANPRTIGPGAVIVRLSTRSTSRPRSSRR